MKRAEPDELSPEMGRLLAKERDIMPESAELKARVLARARTALRHAEVPVTSIFWRRRVLLLVAATLVTAFAAVAIAAWQSSSRDSAHRPSVAPVTSGTHDAMARASRPPIPSARPRPAPQPKSATELAAPERESVVAAPRRSSPSDAYTLELVILQRARAAVANGRFASALDAIADHQRRFPAGNLREEREALRVKALAGLGRDDDARQAAERFRERFPNSVLSPRMEETVRPTR